ncbi:MAG: hypothetical protein LBD46_02180 [Endomicrobium sp.]|jgi:hypothetical protein|nr:hypothetical protein [Endomicrobium sp.]
MPFHLSVFLENKPGRLEKIMKVLAENKINLSAMSLASSGKFGVVKLLVNDPQKAFNELKKQKITVTKRKIAAIVIDNIPGSFYDLLRKLSDKGANIEDCYGFLLNDGKTAAMVLEIENQPAAENILKDIDANMLDESKIYNY